VVSERRDRARLAALADLPGVLDPVPVPVVETWRSEDALRPDVALAAGSVIGVSDVQDGTQDILVIAVDADTGRTRWRTPVLAATTARVGGVSCVAPAAGPGGEAQRVVVCLSIDRLGASPQDLSLLEPRAARMLVLRAATGEVVSEREVDPSTSVDALGSDVVVKETLADDRVRITRTDPLGERERWSFTSDEPDPRREYSWVLVDEGLVVAPGEAGWVLSADGEVLHRWRPARPASAGWADVAAGDVLVQPMRDVVGQVKVVDLRTGRSFEADGYPLRPWADDGSSDPLVLLQSARGDGLVAHERGSGTPRWSVEGEDAGGVLVLDGRVIRVESGALRAVDAATGATVWQTPVPSSGQYGLLTDGLRVLRMEDDPRRGIVVTARGVDDGVLRWQTDVSDDLRHLFVLEGRLMGFSREGIVAFGGPTA
jgi:outer membrane protein assembly factor BamB